MHRSTPPDSSALLVVRRRVHHRPQTGPATPLLQPCLPPARLRASPRLRTPANRTSPPGAGDRRRLVRHRIRAWRFDRPIWEDPRDADERAAGGPATRDLVRRARPTAQWSTFQSDAASSLPCLHQRHRLESAALRHQLIERTLPFAIAARRRDRTTRACSEGRQPDSVELSVAVAPSAAGSDATAATSFTKTCSR
ncbi:MAG: hypothetical protein QOE09_3165 [Ilumatobacteraceae bacterium]